MDHLFLERSLTVFIMQNFRMPAHFAVINQTEQRKIQGGGPVGDALSNFFENLHLTDIYRGSSVIAISFTFVPALLFTVVRSVIGLGQELVGGIFDMLDQF